MWGIGPLDLMCAESARTQQRVASSFTGFIGPELSHKHRGRADLVKHCELLCLRPVVFVRAGAEWVEIPSAQRAVDDRVCTIARMCAYTCAAALRQWPAENDARR